MNDRKIIESLFLAGDLPILCTTSTLSLGVNLPARTVIIKVVIFLVLGLTQQ